MGRKSSKKKCKKCGIKSSSVSDCGKCDVCYSPSSSSSSCGSSSSSSSCCGSSSSSSRPCDSTSKYGSDCKRSSTDISPSSSSSSSSCDYKCRRCPSESSSSSSCSSSSSSSSSSCDFNVYKKKCRESKTSTKTETESCEPSSKPHKKSSKSHKKHGKKPGKTCEKPSSRSETKPDPKPPKKDCFEVTFESKNGYSQAHRIIGDKVIAINKSKAPILRLRRGKTYYFKVNQNPDEFGQYRYNFYITGDMLGGPKGMWADNPQYVPEKVPGSPDKLSHGIFVVHIGKDFPRHSYYQTTETPAMGGLIIVHDGNEKPTKGGKSNKNGNGGSLYDFSAV